MMEFTASTCIMCCVLCPHATHEDTIIAPSVIFADYKYILTSRLVALSMQRFYTVVDILRGNTVQVMLIIFRLKSMILVGVAVGATYRWSAHICYVMTRYDTNLPRLWTAPAMLCCSMHPVMQYLLSHLCRVATNHS